MDFSIYWDGEKELTTFKFVVRKTDPRHEIKVDSDDDPEMLKFGIDLSIEHIDGIIQELNFIKQRKLKPKPNQFDVLR